MKSLGTHPLTCSYMHREFENKEAELTKALAALKHRCLALEKEVREEVSQSYAVLTHHSSIWQFRRSSVVSCCIMPWCLSSMHLISFSVIALPVSSCLSHSRSLLCLLVLLSQTAEKMRAQGEVARISDRAVELEEKRRTVSEGEVCPSLG